MRTFVLVLLAITGCTPRASAPEPEHPSRTPSQDLGEVLAEAGATVGDEGGGDAPRLEDLVGSYAALGRHLHATTLTIRAWL